MKKAHFIAPSFRYLDREIILGVENAKDLEFDLELPEVKLGKFRKFSAIPSKRSEAVNKVFQDPTSKIIFGLKGGYGAIEILNKLDYQAYKQNNKTLIGFSDITAILNAIYQKTGCCAIHGPNIGSMNRKFSPDEKEKLIELINGQEISYSLLNSKKQNIQKNIYQGISVGGNLVIMADLLGSPFQIETKNKIVFLECQTTKGYRIYIKLVQLLNAGCFNECECVVIGTFRKSSFAKKYVEAFFKKYKIPAVWWEEFGHKYPNKPFPIGVETTINLEKEKLTFNSIFTP